MEIYDFTTDNKGPEAFLFQTCPLCDISYQIKIDYSDYAIWHKVDRPFIQDIFYYLTPEKREMIQTGIHPECWDKEFSE